MMVGASQNVSAKSGNLERPGKPAKDEKSEERMIPTICSLCGPMPGCGLNCYVKGGKLIRVEGI